MVEILKTKTLQERKDVPGDIVAYYIEAAGLSSDTKPTEDWYATGSIFVEVDTGNVFFYNATSKQWVEQFSFQG